MAYDIPASRSFASTVEPRLGQLASDMDRFCPFAAVAQYPYRYFDRDPEAKKAVAESFWEGGRFNGHTWSIYYIRNLLGSSPNPLLLIPKGEVLAFFTEIQYKTGFYLPFPDVTNTPGFDIAFQMEGEPRPRYLGRLTGNITLPELLETIPGSGEAPEEPLTLEDSSFAGFRKKMESAIVAGENSHRARKQKKRELAVQKGKWCAQLKRTQCYLGLRPRVIAKIEDFDSGINATWEESQAAKEAYKKAAGMNLPLLDITKPAPYPFNLNVVFICVDIEVHERDQNKLTEIGISTLDTLDIVQTSPGEGGIQWMKQMRCRHFRVAEYAHIVNKDFVRGCPDKFEKKFGTSEWISIDEVQQVVAACFRAPYSAPGYYTPHPTKYNACPRGGSRIQPLVDSKSWSTRNIILVGHQIRSDIQYLRSIGYDLGNLGNLLEAVDTIDLWRAWKHKEQPSKLGNVLLDLELAGWHLHNAGNDAAYTLQALIGIALAALDPAKKAPASPLAELLDEAALEARQKLTEEYQEWADADEEGDDGGDAVKILQLEVELSLSKERKKKEKASQKNWNQSQQTTGGKTFERPTTAVKEKDYGGEMKQQEIAATKPAQQTPPHLRGLSMPVESRSKSLEAEGINKTKPKVALPKLSQQMQKRLVIMDDEEYGM